jgi:hypothetical protein
MLSLLWSCHQTFLFLNFFSYSLCEALVWNGEYGCAKNSFGCLLVLVLKQTGNYAALNDFPVLTVSKASMVVLIAVRF